jgi:hypothetical protein
MCEVLIEGTTIKLRSNDIKKEPEPSSRVEECLSSAIL